MFALTSFLVKNRHNNAHEVFVNIPKRANNSNEPLFRWLQSRFMTRHRRVQDRSRNKRVHNLEVVTEEWKTASKILAIVEILKQEPDMIIAVRDLVRHGKRINLSKPNRFSDFLKKSPQVFELYRDDRGVLWCGLTNVAEGLVAEEERLLEEHSVKAAEFVTRCLMMSVERRLPLDKIAHFRRDFGLPADFRSRWANGYPELFRVVKSAEDGVEYLQLVSWNPAWAVTELEKKVLGASGDGNHEPGLLSLAFPLKFPISFKKVYKFRGKLEDFQKRSYSSPYADASGLTAGSLEFDKRAVAVMHELLSFTLEKRLVTDHLTHFRQEFVMPQKLMRLLLKHFGIFYVSERGKRFSVFLTEAYEGKKLIDKPPLVVWKEKLLRIVGYRARKKTFETYTDSSDMEINDVVDDESEDEDDSVQFETGDSEDDIDVGLISDEEEMNVSDIRTMQDG